MDTFNFILMVVVMFFLIQINEWLLAGGVFVVMIIANKGTGNLLLLLLAAAVLFFTQGHNEWILPAMVILLVIALASGIGNPPQQPEGYMPDPYGGMGGAGGMDMGAMGGAGGMFH